MKQQQVGNQKGEIEFKKKLYSQQVDQKQVFADEFDAAGIEKILKERMDTTRDRMATLRNRAVALSPYLEIGAERGQRSLVMENDIGAHGIAADLSFDMLKSCSHYKTIFNKQNIPARMCCDVNNLPLASNSIPFIFCYQTLHHFPDPAPIIEGLHRVLSPGGCFFFDEEPYKKILHVNLYKTRKLYSQESLNRSFLKKVLDYLFGETNCNEDAYGVIENDDLTIQQWKRALSVFPEKEVQIRLLDFLKSDIYLPSSQIKYFAAYLLGGTISGLCRKAGGLSGGNPPIVYICPSCKETGAEIPLQEAKAALTCPTCHRTYPVVDGVQFLFSYGRFQELYPVIFANFQKRIR